MVELAAVIVSGVAVLGLGGVLTYALLGLMRQNRAAQATVEGILEKMVAVNLSYQGPDTVQRQQYVLQTLMRPKRNVLDVTHKDDVVASRKAPAAQHVPPASAGVEMTMGLPGGSPE